ncbi:MAG: hypothetical protein ACRDD1_14110, partial [Planctomycetia bacterium]
MRQSKTVGVRVLLTATVCFLNVASAFAGGLVAGAAAVDITNREVLIVNDPLYAKALVIKNNAVSLVLITVDAVAVAEIGSIKNDYVANVRTRLKKDLGIEPAGVVVNASHCHGVVCDDVEDRTVEAVKKAVAALEPVAVGAGVGFENRV